MQLSHFGRNDFNQVRAHVKNEQLHKQSDFGGDHCDLVVAKNNALNSLFVKNLLNWHAGQMIVREGHKINSCRNDHIEILFEHEQDLEFSGECLAKYLVNMKLICLGKPLIMIGEGILRAQKIMTFFI
jgi:hypothetical protein